MMQIGMSSKIRNYYKKKYNKDEGPQGLEYGDLHLVNQPPFLGTIKPGECLQTLENHMFRAPIYVHKVAQHDFLVIKSRQSGFIVRGNVKTVFTVGQECPLIEVPAPNSKRANAFIKDFLQVHISRLFYESNEVPRRIKIEDVKKAFPNVSETSIKKRLKLCADPKRGIKNESGK
jgi:transcription initiation factor TFIID subunit 1